MQSFIKKNAIIFQKLTFGRGLGEDLDDFRGWQMILGGG